MESFNVVFNRCWNRHEKAVFTLCLSLLSMNEHDAQDAKSITYIKANRSFSSCRTEEAGNKQWFLKIAKHTCFDIYRSKRREQEVMEDFFAVQNQTNFLGQANSVSPETYAITKQTLLNLNDAIENLPNKLRETIVRYALQEKSYQRISRDMNISECNARKRVQLARKMLKTPSVKS